MAGIETAPAQTAVADLLEQKTLERIRAVDARNEGVIGVAAIDLVSGRRISYHADAVFPQASSIKIPILVEMFKAARAGQFNFDDVVTLRTEELVGGSGHLQEKLRLGALKLTVRELATAMIETSDNTATNKCIRMVGMERVNRTLDEMGFLNTRLRRVMMDSAAARRDEENVSTPHEMARLVERIYRGKAVDAAASQEMLAIMKLVKGDFRRAIPAAIEIASKTGSIPGVKCETGVVYLPGHPFVLSVMSTFQSGEEAPVAELAGIVFRHFEKTARSNQYGHRIE